MIHSFKQFQETQKTNILTQKKRNECNFFEQFGLRRHNRIQACLIKLSLHTSAAKTQIKKKQKCNNRERFVISSQTAYVWMRLFDALAASVWVLPPLIKRDVEWSEASRRRTMPVPTPVNSRSPIVLDRFRIPCGKCGNLNGLVYKLVRIWLWDVYFKPA